MKSGLYFKKDKKCMVYVEDNAPHGVGEDPELEPVSETSLWCYTKQLTQGLVAQSGVVYANNETRLFVFNYRNDVTQGDYLLYRGVWYEVSRTDTTEDYKGELFIYVKNLKAAPKENQIKPYGYEP